MPVAPQFFHPLLLPHDELIEQPEYRKSNRHIPSFKPTIMTVPNVYKSSSLPLLPCVLETKHFTTDMKAVIKAGERTARIKEAIKEGFLAIKEKFPHRKDRDSVFIRYPTNVIYVGGHTSASPTPIVWVENPHYNRV